MIEPIPITSPSDIGEDTDDDFEAALELLRMPDPLEAVVKSAISNPYYSIDVEYTITDDEVEDIYNEVMTSINKCNVATL